MNETYRLWGENIAVGRKAVGYETQLAFALVLGVRQSTIARWESGEMAPRDHHKVSIAELLHQDVRQLFPLTRAVAS